MSFDDFNTARDAQRVPGLSSLAPTMVVVPPNIGKAEAIRGFKAHADSTNDIFHIAAQVIARVILQASKAAASTSTPGKHPCLCIAAAHGSSSLSMESQSTYVSAVFDDTQSHCHISAALRVWFLCKI